VKLISAADEAYVNIIVDVQQTTVHQYTFHGVSDPVNVCVPEPRLIVHQDCSYDVAVIELLPHESIPLYTLSAVGDDKLLFRVNVHERVFNIITLLRDNPLVFNVLLPLPSKVYG